MEHCYKCGINGQLAKLSNAITSEGIVKICDLCAKREHHPIISQTEISRQKEVQNSLIKKRLSKTNYLNPEIQNTSRDEDAHLKEIIKINFEQKRSENPQKRDDLIENFHWIIMRARRLKHITQEQLAKELKVSEPTIKAAEKGIIEEEGYDLVHKIETYLSIRIINPDIQKTINETQSKKIGFDPIATKELTINDLIDLKAKNDAESNPTEESAEKEANIPTEDELDEIEEEINSQRNETILMGEPTKKSEISQDELENMIFRK